jgi:hypothetical protein
LEFTLSETFFDEAALPFAGAAAGASGATSFFSALALGIVANTKQG